ncbi:MAG: YcnI family protein [Alphaproteobacteria bacterium]
MRAMRKVVAILPIAAAIAASAANAHVTLEAPEAKADTYYKAVLRVGHGCDGSPTVKLRVRLPDGATAVRPQPKTGWEIAIVKEKLATPIRDGHGNLVTEAVVEVAWSGGRLLDEHYDEFAVRLKLPNRPGETIAFPTVQECEVGTHRWIEVPEGGKSAADYKEPAPLLRLLPK